MVPGADVVRILSVEAIYNGWAERAASWMAGMVINALLSAYSLEARDCRIVGHFLNRVGVCFPACCHRHPPRPSRYISSFSTFSLFSS